MNIRVFILKFHYFFTLRVLLTYQNVTFRTDMGYAYYNRWISRIRNVKNYKAYKIPYIWIYFVRFINFDISNPWFEFFDTQPLQFCLWQSPSMASDVLTDCKHVYNNRFLRGRARVSFFFCKITWYLSK